MLSVWPLIIVLAVGVILVGLLVAGPRVFKGFRNVRYCLRCPRWGRDVDVEFQETAWDGKPVDVTRCSVFTPPTAVACDKACLDRTGKT